MAATVRSIARWRGRIPSPSCLLQGARHSHTQSLWEQILGRKIEPSTVKALEEAVLEFRLSKSVPSWLPFLPNSSFWVPSSEMTLKNLEDIAERVQSSAQRPPKRQSGPSFVASADLINNGISSLKALSAIQVTDQLVDKLEDIPLEDGMKILLVDASNMETGIDEDDEDDGDDGVDEGDEGEESEEESGSVKIL